MALTVGISLNTSSTSNPASITVTLTVTNTDLVNSVLIDQEPLIAPSVALDLEPFGGGSPIGMLPPPVPDPANTPHILIGAGGNTVFVYENFLDLPPGSYQVRGHYVSTTPPGTDEVSSWEPFTIL